MWREQVEASHGAVIYVAEPEFDTWTDECVQHADLVLLAAAAGGARVIRPIEHELAPPLRLPVSRRTELVLLHEPTVDTPRGVRHWVRDRAVNGHHNVRVDRDRQTTTASPGCSPGRRSAWCSAEAGRAGSRTSASSRRCAPAA